MFNLNNKNLQIVALIVAAVSIKLYLDHRKAGYAGDYQISGQYANISATKHDVTKALWVEIFSLLVYGLASGEPFYDQNNILGSWVGKAGVVMMAYFAFFEFIQPYIVNKLPNM